MYDDGSQEVPTMDDHPSGIDKDLNRSFYDNTSTRGLAISPPKAPKRRKRGNFRETKSMEKDAFLNGFGGRSVSNSYIEDPNQHDDVRIFCLLFVSMCYKYYPLTDGSL